MGKIERLTKPNIQREAILRFWTSMNHLDYDEVVREYLGQADHQALMVSNKLYANVEAAAHMMEEYWGCVDCGKRRCENCERLWQT